MNRFVVFIMLLVSNGAYSWECGQNQEEFEGRSKLEYLWAHKKSVFIGTLQKGEITEKPAGYLCSINVKVYLKGSGQSPINYHADWSSPLTFGEQYVFFTDGDGKLDICDFYREFSLQWLNREDIPHNSAFVEEIVKITGYKGSP